MVRAQLRLYPYTPVSDPPRDHRVIVVGAGPVGLALALDLGLRGTPVLLLDEGEGPGQGSRAICFAKRTLDIAHRLGCGAPIVDGGVVWNVGRVFHADRPLFEFNLQPEGGQRHPAFVNLAQPWFEKALVDRIREVQARGAPIEIRGGNRVTGVAPRTDGVDVQVTTPDGNHTLRSDYLVACDGARSALRGMLGLGFDGRVFEDNFLIADVRMTAGFPTERWFWFAPAFEHAGQSALLHKQPDDIWRIDFQLGWDIDRQAELDPARIRARVDAMLSSQTGKVPDYDLVWTSIYTFQCRRMQAFRQGAVFFAGDAAHQVSPFGARGANSGVQDAENLAWKLDLALKGLGGDALLDSYAAEREAAADENILHSTRATDFLTPKTENSRVFRDAVLTLAGRHAFARPFVNSGRLSVPCTYDDLPLTGEDALDGPAMTRPGSACPDAALAQGYLLDLLTEGFTILAINAETPHTLKEAGVCAPSLVLPATPDVARRYLGTAVSAVYLIRPDQHVVARWPDWNEPAVRRALRHALALE